MYFVVVVVKSDFGVSRYYGCVVLQFVAGVTWLDGVSSATGLGPKELIPSTVRFDLCEGGGGAGENVWGSWPISFDSDVINFVY
jgi:hypothetical protein